MEFSPNKNLKISGSHRDLLSVISSHGYQIKDLRRNEVIEEDDFESITKNLIRLDHGLDVICQKRKFVSH
jgi:hypothetical protein